MLTPIGAPPIRGEHSALATQTAPERSFGRRDGADHGAPCTHADWVAWLEAHPNWAKLGPKRKEIAVLLALNELDPATGVLSSATNRELTKRYPGYTAADFKNTFAALRRYGIARPEEQFVAAQFGRLQTATRYTLVASEHGEPWSTGEFRAVRSHKAALTRRERKVGRLSFTPAENQELRRSKRRRPIHRANRAI